MNQKKQGDLWTDGTAIAKAYRAIHYAMTHIDNLDYDTQSGYLAREGESVYAQLAEAARSITTHVKADPHGGTYQLVTDGGQPEKDPILYPDDEL